MGLGVWQVILILVIVLIIFGAGKLPRVMGDVAQGVKNFRSGLKEEDDNQDDTSSARQLDEDGRSPNASGSATTGSATTGASSTAGDKETHRDGVSKS